MAGDEFPRYSRGEGRRVRASNGLAAALVLLALVVGLPLVLVRVAGNPLAGFPAVGDLWTALTSRDSGQLFLRTLAIVGWLAWATFAMAVLVEISAQIRGRRTIRIRGLGPQQKLASVLVAAVAAVLITPSLSAAAVTPARASPPAAVSICDTPMRGSPPTTVDHPTTVAASPGCLMHQVQRGESLLGLSERYGVSLPTLAEANYGVPQPDGRALQPGHTRIYHGWTLRIPLSTPTVLVPVAVDIDATDPAADNLVYEVRRGDWLGGIAERYLGDFGRYPEIAALNPHLEARDHRFPDHLEATWRITLPADAYDRGPRHHATGHVITPGPADPGTTQPGTPGQDGDTPTDPPGTSPPSSAQPGASPSQPTQPSPSTSPSMSPGTSPSRGASGSPSPSGSSDPGASSSATTNPDASTPGSSSIPRPPDGRSGPAPTDEDLHHTGIVIGGSLISAGLLAALVLRAVTHRRRQQHRRPGRRLPHPRDGTTERNLRIVEQPLDVDRLDTALRHLGAGLADRDQTSLPDIVAAWVDSGDVQLLLAHPCEDPPAPWLDEGQQWTLPGRVPLPDVSGEVPPLPALAAVGSQTGRHLLLDLERLGSLTVTGDPERATALLRYLAAELASNSWSEEIEVILVGFDATETELLTALNPQRVRTVASVSEAAARVHGRIVAATATLHNVGAVDAFAGRVADLAGDSWMPQILLVANPDDRDLAALHDLDADLVATGRCAVAVAAITHGTDRVGQATASVTDDGILHVSLPTLHLSTVAASLPADELEPLAEIMRQARSASDVPVPVAAEIEPWARGTDAAGGILGLDDTDLTPFAQLASSSIGASDLDTAGETRAARDADTTSETDPTHEWDADRLVDTADTVDTGIDVGWVTEAPQEPDAVRDITTAEQESPTPPPAATLARATAPAPAEPARSHGKPAVRQRYVPDDPHLDEDLTAWQQRDPTRPRIAVLGPVRVEGLGEQPEQRRRFHAEVIVYLAARGARGADRHQLEDALWPDRSVKDGALRTAISRVRRWLGDQPDGRPWLPDMTADRNYRLADGVLLDWHLFRRLRARGQAYGPAGAGDLRAALGLVRGAPLDGADRPHAAGGRNPFTWLPESDIFPPHIVCAIVDTAHELAGHYLDVGDTAGARWAVQRAWLADPYRGDDEPWQDIMRTEHADGHTAELRHLFAELMRSRDAEVPEDLQPATFDLARTLLPELIYPPPGECRESGSA